MAALVSKADRKGASLKKLHIVIYFYYFAACPVKYLIIGYILIFKSFRVMISAGSLLLQIIQRRRTVSLFAVHRTLCLTKKMEQCRVIMKNNLQ